MPRHSRSASAASGKGKGKKGARYRGPSLTIPPRGDVLGRGARDRADTVSSMPPAFRERRRTLCGANTVKTVAVTQLLISATMFIFGRGVVPIIQGVLGIVFSLEGYHGSQTRLRPRETLIFLIYLTFNTVASCFVAFVTLKGIYPDCGSCDEDRPFELAKHLISPAERTICRTCKTTVRMYGYVVLIGGGGLGCFFAAVVLLFYCRLRDAAKAPPGSPQFGGRLPSASGDGGALGDVGGLDDVVGDDGTVSDPYGNERGWFEEWKRAGVEAKRKEARADRRGRGGRDGGRDRFCICHHFTVGRKGSL